MRFGEIAVAEAGGAILAHSLRLPGPEGGRGPTFKKGRRLTAGDAAALAAAGYATVTAARLDADDIWEDEAAARLADAARGPASTPPCRSPAGPTCSPPPRASR